jgi:hypothetical protein
MNDNTVKRAIKQGARSQPVSDRRRRPIRLRGEVTLAPDELALAMELARAERIKDDIAAYALVRGVKPAEQVCAFEDCGRDKYGHGLCKAHLWQQKRGSELKPITERKKAQP